MVASLANACCTWLRDDRAGQAKVFMESVRQQKCKEPLLFFGHRT